MSDRLHAWSSAGVALLALSFSMAAQAQYDGTPNIGTNATTRSRPMIVHNVHNKAYYGYGTTAFNPDGYLTGHGGVGGTTPSRTVLVTNRSLSTSGGYATRVGGCDAGLRLATLAQKWYCPPDTDPDTVVSLVDDQYAKCEDYAGKYGIAKGAKGVFKLSLESNSKHKDYGAIISADTRSCQAPS